MDENNNNKDKLIKKEEQTHSLDKPVIHRSFFLSKTYFHSNRLQIHNPLKDKKISQKEIKYNFKRQLSLLNSLKNKSYLAESRDFHMSEILNQDKNCSFTKNTNNNFIKNKKVNFDMSGNKKQFYITSSYDPSSPKDSFKNFSSLQNLNLNEKKNNNYIIDLIHEKEIQLCLDLIKAIPDNKNDKHKRLNIIKDFRNKRANNIIKLIKTFNFDNIFNQRLLEEQILNNSNNNYNSENNKAQGTFSVSMSTNYKTNTNIPLNSMYKFNLSNITNNKNNSSVILKNNNSSFNKYFDESNALNNNNVSVNEKLMKSKLTKSINNKFNNKSEKGPKSEINFHTGFVRSQKNIYDDVYSKYFKNNSKTNAMRVKRFRKKKLEANKLSLPEIEEYKSIVKDIESRRKKALKKSKSMLDINRNSNDLLLKDQLMVVLNNIYQDQKNSFLSSLKNNTTDTEKIKIDSYKNEINENIRNINKNKRIPNQFIDGYSIFEGKINKKLDQYNYLLGNRFHNKEQKLEKAKKFIDISNEFENKVKYYKKVLLNERFKYENMFKQNIVFDKDTHDITEDVKCDMDQYFNKNDIVSVALRNKDQNNYKIKNLSYKNFSRNKSYKDKIYEDYTNFKNECKKIYSLD